MRGALCHLSYTAEWRPLGWGPPCAVPVPPQTALTGDPAGRVLGPGRVIPASLRGEGKQGTPSPGNATALPGPGGCLSQRHGYWPLPYVMVGHEWT
jgi:hypothetical protein